MEEEQLPGLYSNNCLSKCYSDESFLMNSEFKEMEAKYLIVLVFQCTRKMHNPDFQSSPIAATGYFSFCISVVDKQF